MAPHAQQHSRSSTKASARGTRDDVAEDLGHPRAGLRGLEEVGSRTSHSLPRLRRMLRCSASRCTVARCWTLPDTVTTGSQSAPICSQYNQQCTRAGAACRAIKCGPYTVFDARPIRRAVLCQSRGRGFKSRRARQSRRTLTGHGNPCSRKVCGICAGRPHRSVFLTEFSSTPSASSQFAASVFASASRTSFSSTIRYRR